MSAAATAAPDHGGALALGRAAVHLIALSSLAFAQPLLDVLGRYPAFFAAHDVTRWGVVAFALVVLLVPGLSCLPSRRSPRSSTGAPGGSSTSCSSAPCSPCSR